MKKYAILATLMLLAIGLGSFQYWAVGSQSTASAGVGTIPDSVDVWGYNKGTIIGGNSGDVDVVGRPGKVKGDQYLFKIKPAASYNGDYKATLYLVNAGELADELRYLNINVSCRKYSNAGNQKGEEFKALTLDNGRVEFHLDWSNDNGDGVDYYRIYIEGGSYYANRAMSPGEINFILDVEETGTTS